jgi:hypothetical protein
MVFSTLNMKGFGAFGITLSRQEPMLIIGSMVKVKPSFITPTAYVRRGEHRPPIPRAAQVGYY